MANWDMELSEMIGKALPNEFSKWSSFTKYIPYIGQLLQILGGVDAGATAYSDIRETGKEKGKGNWEAIFKGLGTGIQSGVSTGMGQGSDPGRFGSGGSKHDAQWQDYLMDVGNLFSAGKSGDKGGMFSGGMGLYNDISGNTYGTDPWAKQTKKTSSQGSQNWNQLFSKINKEQGLMPWLPDLNEEEESMEITPTETQETKTQETKTEIPTVEAPTVPEKLPALPEKLPNMDFYNLLLRNPGLSQMLLSNPMLGR